MMGTTKWWQRVAAAGCAIGAALTLAVASAGSASATVDENPQPPFSLAAHSELSEDYFLVENHPIDPGKDTVDIAPD